MRTEVARLQSDLGTTTVYVTHDQTEAMTLGDRVAVMRAGVLQQVGTPAELYGNPRNLFVAGFIGSPAMNFMPGKLNGEKVVVPLGELPLPDRLREGSREARNVIVGIRPENFEDLAMVGEDGRDRGITFTAQIDLVESMGSEQYAYFEIKGEGPVHAAELDELAQDAGMEELPGGEDASQVVARVDAGSGIKRGEQAELWLDTTKIHCFDPETGKSLAPT
jgi:multiple sugar transport system ATP-binding protein